MAISFATKAGGATPGNWGTSPAQTDTFTPGNNVTLVAVVSAQEASNQTGHNDIGALLTLGNINSSLDWDKIDYVTWDADGPGGPNNGAFNMGLAIWSTDVINGSDHTNMQVTADCGDSYIYSYVVRVYELSGELILPRAVGKGFDNGSGSGGFSVTLDQTPLSDSLLLAILGMGGGGASSVIGDTGWTEIEEFQPDFQKFQSMRQIGLPSPAVDWTDAASSFGADTGRAGLAVEFAIDDASPLTTVYREHLRRLKAK